MHFLRASLPRRARNGTHLITGEQAVYPVNINERPAFPTVQVRPSTRQHFSLVKAKHDFPVLLIRALKSLFLPPLAFITAEIVNIERLIWPALGMQGPLQLNQALPARVNGKPAQIG